MPWLAIVVLFSCVLMTSVIVDHYKTKAIENGCAAYNTKTGKLLWSTELK